MLKLYYHPLASFCWKVLIALYERDTPFEGVIVDQSNLDAYKDIWPVGKFPLLVDDGRGHVVPESTIIIEYLDENFGGGLLPADADAARAARLQDRFYDHYVHHPMQKIVLDRLRPKESRDAFGVAEARVTLATAYEMIERDMAGKVWALGDAFTLADCAASPALFYADKVAPLAEGSEARAYLERLKQRPSFARVLQEAEPYFANFPQE